MMLYQMLALYMGKYKQQSSKNNEFKISSPMLNDKFEKLDGSYSVADIKGF